MRSKKMTNMMASISFYTSQRKISMFFKLFVYYHKTLLEEESSGRQKGSLELGAQGPPTYSFGGTVWAADEQQ